VHISATSRLIRHSLINPPFIQTSGYVNSVVIICWGAQVDETLVTLQRDISSLKFYADDYGLALLIKGCALRLTRKHKEAEACFKEVCLSMRHTRVYLHSSIYILF